MSIENHQNICYNIITKEEQSNEKLNFRFQSFGYGGKIERVKEPKSSRSILRNVFLIS